MGHSLHSAFRVVLTIGLMAALLCPVNAFAEPRTEYKVKAAFLYHFSQFTEWPAEVLTQQDTHIRICHFGDTSFVDFLERTFAGKVVRSREFHVRHNVSSAQIPVCHVVFVDLEAAKKPQRIQAILQKSTGLVVGESEGFLEQGGMVQLYREDNKIRFAINPDALDEKRIRLSSKLLRLAKIVRSK